MNIFSIWRSSYTKSNLSDESYFNSHSAIESSQDTIINFCITIVTVHTPNKVYNMILTNDIR
jgi:hypothetical protein